MTSDVEADRRVVGRIGLADGEDDRWLADGKDSGWAVEVETGKPVGE